MTTPSVAAGRGGRGRGPYQPDLAEFPPRPEGLGVRWEQQHTQGCTSRQQECTAPGITCPGCGPETPDPLRRLVLFIPILLTKPLRHRELRKSRAGPEPDLWASEPTRPSATPTTSAAGCAKPHLLAPAGVDSRREQTQSGRLANHGYSRPRRPLSRHSSLCAPNLSSLRGGTSPSSSGPPVVSLGPCEAPTQPALRSTSDH